MITGCVEDDGAAARSGEILLLAVAVVVAANPVVLKATREPSKMGKRRYERNTGTPRNRVNMLNVYFF